MKQSNLNIQVAKAIEVIDNELSNRFISLDPKGYFIIKLDYSLKRIIVEHYKNDIDPEGRAVHPETGELIGCDDNNLGSPTKIYSGRSAKEVGIEISEGNDQLPISSLDHAIYLGRELQKAEECLKNNAKYQQD